MHMKDLDIAIELRRQGKLKESNELLILLVNSHPDNPTINYQCAWSFDVLELEKEAVKYYENAISLGLEGEDLQGAILGLGSTYRTIGEYKKSKAILKIGLDKFPHDRSIQIFYSMTLYNLNEHSEAMKILLENLAETSSDENIKNYKKAISFYSDKLDTIF